MAYAVSVPLSPRLCRYHVSWYLISGLDNNYAVTCFFRQNLKKNRPIELKIAQPYISYKLKFQSIFASGMCYIFFKERSIQKSTNKAVKFYSVRWNRTLWIGITWNLALFSLRTQQTFRDRLFSALDRNRRKCIFYISTI